MKPLCIDLFSGLGGWSEGFIAEGYECVGFDIERHDYGTGGYPGQLVIQDVLTIHGSQFRDAAIIVASPPCQEFSYMAMPWSRGKQIAKALRGGDTEDFPEGYDGSWNMAQLKALFYACFRIQVEASHAARRYIPMVIENVRGAQPWVGQAKANYGSFYLWGDIAMVGRRIIRPDLKGEALLLAPGRARQFQEGQKTAGLVNIRDGHSHTRHLTNQYEHDAVKHGGDWFSDPTSPGRQGGVKKTANGYEGMSGWGNGHTGSKSDSRKAASAQIAKIPFPLSRHIARCYKPGASRMSEHKSTLTPIQSQTCPGCCLRRAQAEFRDQCGNVYQHCRNCRDKHRELRKPKAVKP